MQIWFMLPNINIEFTIWPCQELLVHLVTLDPLDHGETQDPLVHLAQLEPQDALGQEGLQELQVSLDLLGPLEQQVKFPQYQYPK